jgi:hypothetical protein
MDGGNESFIKLKLVGVWTHAAQENQEKKLSVGKKMPLRVVSYHDDSYCNKNSLCKLHR